MLDVTKYALLPAPAPPARSADSSHCSQGRRTATAARARARRDRHPAQPHRARPRVQAQDGWRHHDQLDGAVDTDRREDDQGHPAELQGAPALLLLRALAASEEQADALLPSQMHNADVMIREDVSTDDVIDAILGNRKYVPCLCVLRSLSVFALAKETRPDHLAHLAVQVRLQQDRLDLARGCARLPSRGARASSSSTSPPGPPR